MASGAAVTAANTHRKPFADLWGRLPRRPPLDGRENEPGREKMMMAEASTLNPKVGTLLIGASPSADRDAFARVLHACGNEVHLSENPAHLLACVNAYDYEAVFVDTDLPGNAELELVHHLEHVGAYPPIVVLDANPTLDRAMHCVRLPVRSYLSRPLDYRHALQELNRVVTPPERSSGEVAEWGLRRISKKWHLTHRQSEVLRLLVRGEPNKSIAESAGCSVRTIEQHVSALLTKSGSESRLELAARFWTTAYP